MPTTKLNTFKTIWSHLKLGADANSSARQARLTAAYDSKKKTEAAGAMAFNDPTNSTIWNDN